MPDAISRMQQIKGVGEVLAHRLVEAGFDTLPRLADATDEELAAIEGLLPGNIPALREQAIARVAAQGETDETSLTQMLDDAERLRKGWKGWS